jgi:imidazolonepropionase-like amidohydrolase
MGLETAAIAAIGSAAVKAIGAGMSFKQASEQQRLMREAQASAAKAIAQARGELSTNYMAGLSIAMEPYDLEREAMIQSAAQAIEAARESDRGIGSIPLIQRQAQEAQRRTRADMAAEMQRLNQVAATEESRLAAARSRINQIEAMGAQEAAAYRENAYNVYMNQMLKQMGGAAQDMLGLIPTNYNLPEEDSSSKTNTINEQHNNG